MVNQLARLGAAGNVPLGYLPVHVDRGPLTAHHGRSFRVPHAAIVVQMPCPSGQPFVVVSVDDSEDVAGTIERDGANHPTRRQFGMSCGTSKICRSGARVGQARHACPTKNPTMAASITSTTSNTTVSRCRLFSPAKTRAMAGFMSRRYRFVGRRDGGTSETP